MRRRWRCVNSEDTCFRQNLARKRPEIPDLISFGLRVDVYRKCKECPEHLGHQLLRGGRRILHLPFQLGLEVILSQVGVINESFSNLLDVIRRPQFAGREDGAVPNKAIADPVLVGFDDRF